MADKILSVLLFIVGLFLILAGLNSISTVILKLLPQSPGIPYLIGYLGMTVLMFYLAYRALRAASRKWKAE